MLPNWEQIKGVVERAAYWLLLWLVANDVIPKELVTEILGVIMTVTSLVYGWYVNRQTILLQAAKGTAGGAEAMVREVAKMPEVEKVVAPNLSHLSEVGAKVTTQ